VALMVVEADQLRQRVNLRHDAEPGTRTHFIFEYRAPKNPGSYTLSLRLAPSPDTAFPNTGDEFLSVSLEVQSSGGRR